jgi:hypothetical protein
MASSGIATVEMGSVSGYIDKLVGGAVVTTPTTLRPEQAERAFRKMEHALLACVKSSMWFMGTQRDAGKKQRYVHVRLTKPDEPDADPFERKFHGGYGVGIGSPYLKFEQLYSTPEGAAIFHKMQLYAAGGKLEDLESGREDDWKGCTLVDYSIPSERVSLMRLSWFTPADPRDVEEFLLETVFGKGIYKVPTEHTFFTVPDDVLAQIAETTGQTSREILESTETFRKKVHESAGVTLPPKGEYATTASEAAPRTPVRVRNVREAPSAPSKPVFKHHEAAVAAPAPAPQAMAPMMPSMGYVQTAYGLMPAHHAAALAFGMHAMGMLQVPGQTLPRQ